MDTMLAGIKGAVAYLDDVITVGRTEEEYSANLENRSHSTNVGFH
uniref:Reverse transcriptase domain-containing protein n=1 Tax=Parascaris equorum TaxID=6256 RepID=A0A914RAD1_PAREQ